MLSSNEKARESLDAQVSYHESRLVLIEQRKEYFKKKADEYQKRKADALLKKQQKDSLNSEGTHVQGDDISNGEHNQVYLESEIYRVIEEHDSLLQFLIEHQDGPSDRKQDTASSLNSSYKSGAKVPKCDKMVIEELRMNNDQLRQLVQQLVGELEKVQKENHQMRVELITFRAEKVSAICPLPELPPLEPPKLLY